MNDVSSSGGPSSKQSQVPRNRYLLALALLSIGIAIVGTGNRLEGEFSAGERVCLVEDVVTSGGAALEAIEALREAGLECGTVVCVVDREEGGADALARAAVRLWPLFRAQEFVNA